MIKNYKYKESGLAVFIHNIQDWNQLDCSYIIVIIGTTCIVCLNHANIRLLQERDKVAFESTSFYTLINSPCKISFGFITHIKPAHDRYDSV